MYLGRLLLTTALLLGAATSARADGAITVAFAGSMGVVMDRGLAPAFEAATGTKVHGIGQAAMALAHLITGKSITPDVFVSVSQPPMKLVEAAGLADHAIPVASTSIVLAYAPKSSFAAQLAAKNADWPTILTTPGLRFGRTDPAADPQGQYVLYTLQLAEIFYKHPGLTQQVAGAPENPAEIFAEPSLLARLESGQIDATLGYESAIISQHLPFIPLPAAINFSNPALARSSYDKASLTLTIKGVTKTLHPSPLVFYAAVLKNAANPQAATEFVKFLNGPQGQSILAQYGYNPGKGPAL
jgi:molybdate/tungstate transport system substrate-binding protein